MINPTRCLLAILICSPLFAAEGRDRTNNTTAPDTFEKIAEQAQTEVPGLVPNPPPQLPDVNLPWDAEPGGGFQAMEKITTQAQLDAELQRMRVHYAPFMADLAPAMPARPSHELIEFDWRLADHKNPAPDLAAALAGTGEWKRVSIPHYEGPIGKAASYYRTEVVIDDTLLSRDALFLHFNGADYYADVYVNGRLIGSHEGVFDAFEFDIKPFVKPGKNIILIRVGNDGVPIGAAQPFSAKTFGSNIEFGPKLATCTGPGWNNPDRGWNCGPPGFGLWQRAWLEARSVVFINDIHVRPMLAANKAEVWVEVGDTAGGGSQESIIRYSLHGQNFQATLVEDTEAGATLQAGEVALFSSPQRQSAAAKPPSVRLFKFTVPIPKDRLRVWEPDSPWLLQIQVGLVRDGKVKDQRKRQFGMRSFEQSATSIPKGRFYLNGRQIRLRGANMMGNIMQCVMRRDDDQLRDDILLAKIAHMNFFRMTQQPCQAEAYDCFDKLGLMVQTDLPLFHYIPATQKAETLRQAGAMLRHVRSHACNVMISYINEPMNGSRGGIARIPEREMVELFRQIDALIPGIHPDQVRKWVDGDYQNLSGAYSDHHCYNLWYWKHCLPFASQYRGAWTKTRAGWMHGCGEYGSEGMDSVPFMRKHYPAAWLAESADEKWMPDRIPGCQSNRPQFHRWISGSQPPPATMNQWVEASRSHQQRATRLIVEALRRNPRMNSTALHLLIDAWPNGWLKSVMDYDRQAKPAYFEFRDAQSPLAVNLRPERFYGFAETSVKVGTWICNDTQEVAVASLRYQLEVDGRIARTGTAPARIVACEPEFQGWLEVAVPAVSKRTPMKLRVALFDKGGKLRHDSAVELEALPPAPPESKPQNPGGRWQFLIES